ncbi:MAG: HAMP domain-containing histidine kinase, partial [Flavobacteriales bacterium]|nr:HAMP domain-containing histidine kinase [Flavobacteriales bacterium]
EISQHQVEVIQSPQCWETYIHCDEVAFTQIAINLLLNALQATEPNGHISIQCIKSGNDTRTEVHFSDTGSGIAVSELERIFDPFHTTKDTGSGTGLGLSICYNLMTSMNGKIRVHSELGKGSDFILEFPQIQN